MRFALLTTALLAAAATRGGCDPSQVPPYDPCAGKSCGDSCKACPPDDPSCFETAVVKACDARGLCAPAGTFVCSAADCAGKPCGTPCDAPCPLGAPCPAPVACDGKGACAPLTISLCGGPCAGKACGEACTYDPPCRLASPPCMVPSVVGQCDATGACVPGLATCTPFDPCAGKKCGETCSLCPPGATGCVEPMVLCVMACDGTGRCTCAGADPLAACADACAGSGGKVVTEQCCTSAQPFPNTCLIGACGCSAQNSAPLSVCVCPAGQCFDGMRCVAR